MNCKTFNKPESKHLHAGLYKTNALWGFFQLKQHTHAHIHNSPAFCLLCFLNCYYHWTTLAHSDRPVPLQFVRSSILLKRSNPTLGLMLPNHNKRGDSKSERKQKTQLARNSSGWQRDICHSETTCLPDIEWTIGFATCCYQMFACANNRAETRIQKYKIKHNKLKRDIRMKLYITFN